MRCLKNRFVAGTSIAAGIMLSVASGARAQFTPASGSPIPAGSTPGAVAVGRFNGDTNLDIVVANYGSTNNVTVLMGDGTGAFITAPGSPLTAAVNPRFIAVANLNGDPFPDLAIANAGSNNVTILTGSATGFIAPAGGTYKVGNNPVYIVAADLTGKGKTDLAVANEADNTISILLNDGSGGFTNAPGSPITVGLQPVSIAVADFNLDGFLDLAITNRLDGSVTVLLNIAKNPGTFMAAPKSPFSVFAAGQTRLGAYPVAVASADFNGDYLPDLAIANQGTNNVSILTGDGTGGFQLAAGSPVAAGSAPASVAIADFNEDGAPDLAIVDYAGNVSVLLGNGSSGFVNAPNSPFPAGSSPVAVAVGDFNNDGKPDLVVANKSGNNVSVLLNQFTGSAAVSAASGVGPVAPGSIASIYGSNLAAASATAPAGPLPMALGGVSVTITDSKGVQASLPLSYVSSAMINAQIPLSAAAGAGVLTVFNGSSSQGIPVVIASVAPGLFSANENGRGVAAAFLLTNMPNGFQTVAPVFQCPAGPPTCVDVPLNISSGTAVLVLYGTGLRNAASVGFTVKIGNSMPLTPAFAGPANSSGLDQINVVVPAALVGSGLVPVSVTANGITSNTVTVYLQ